MALTATFGSDVRPWLKLAEDLRALNLETELNVPQICVMGDQSSGKSSVLEALSGIPFPRGSGLVTRCPIRLVMRKAREHESWFAVVSTSVEPNKRIPVSEVSALSPVIERLTQSLCQGSNQFSTDSIIIDLVSPDACDLTVVDLPGIIRTVTAGQSVSVIDQVNRLIKSFLIDKRTIILAVIPANQDIATVDILERAQGVDPQGERTVGVLTKTDLIGPGSEDEILAVVRNIRKPLALGYIMVKNRSQKDLIENVSTSQARERELQFFSTHPVFRNCDPSVYGVDQLSKKLTLLLVSRIQKGLSPMKAIVEKELGLARASLRSMNAFSVPKTPSDRQKLLVAVMQEYLRHLTDSIRGEYRDRIMVQNSGVRMYTAALKSFEEFQFKVMETQPKFKADGFVHHLASQIDQLRGRELPGFLSSQAFYMCMSLYVDTWVQPMQEMLGQVRVVVAEVAGQLADVILKQYPALRAEIRVATASILNNTADETTKQLLDTLDREKDPFTLNDFLQQWVNKLRFDRFSDAIDDCFDSLGSVAAPPASGSNSNAASANWNAAKDQVFQNLRQWYRSTHSISALANAQDMSAILEAYWNLSAKRFVDQCCMLTDKMLLGTLSSSMQEYMYKFVRDDKKLESFFLEDPATAQQRDDAEKRRDRLIQASSALSSIPVHFFAMSSLSDNTTEDVEEAEPEDISPPVVEAVTQAPASKATSAATAPSWSIAQSAAGASNAAAASKPPQQSAPVAPAVDEVTGNDGKLYTRVALTLQIGNNGMGVIVTDNKYAQLVVTGFRESMPGNGPNPSIEAGMKIGDILEKINGNTPKTIQEAGNMIRSSKGAVPMIVLRPKK